MLYAMNVSSGRIPECDALRISRWGAGMAYEVYNRGQLRDVYPWNFLTSLQLNATIGGIRLREWIGELKLRGTLTELTREVTLWEVGAEQIPLIRVALDELGVIFDYERELS